LPKFSPIPVFVRRFVGFFRRFVGFSPFPNRQTHAKNWKNCKITKIQNGSEAEKNAVPPAIIPEKAIILHTLEDAGMFCQF
jgi:hypothetical protein